MREIKFRVWNKKTNSWIHGPGKEINLLGEVILFGEFLRHISVKDLDNIEVCQFTGMVDSRGVEIYENDVLCEQIGKYGPEFTGELNIGRVYFAAGAYFINGDGTLYDQTESINPNKVLDYIVIGNIFENPKLSN